LLDEVNLFVKDECSDLITLLHLTNERSNLGDTAKPFVLVWACCGIVLVDEEDNIDSREGHRSLGKLNWN